MKSVQSFLDGIGNASLSFNVHIRVESIEIGFRVGNFDVIVFISTVDVNVGFALDTRCNLAKKVVYISSGRITFASNVISVNSAWVLIRPSSSREVSIVTNITANCVPTGHPRRNGLINHFVQNAPDATPNIVRSGSSGNYKVLADHARAGSEVNKVVLEIHVKRLRLKDLAAAKGADSSTVSGQSLVGARSALIEDCFAGGHHADVDTSLGGEHKNIRRDTVNFHVVLDLGVHNIDSLDVLLKTRPHLALVAEEGARSLDKACELAAVLFVVVLTSEKSVHDAKVARSMDRITDLL